MAQSNRQTTMAKLAREQSVRERRARKQKKKEDRKQAAALLKSPQPDAGGPEDEEVGVDEDGEAASP